MKLAQVLIWKLNSVEFSSVEDVLDNLKRQLALQNKVYSVNIAIHYELLSDIV